MNKPTLMILAAGMGSRYGGLKQIDPVGPSGEIVLDGNATSVEGKAEYTYAASDEQAELTADSPENAMISNVKAEYIPPWSLKSSAPYNAAARSSAKMDGSSLRSLIHVPSINCSTRGSDDSLAS